MPKRVHRPKAKKGKIHSKNEFELCYLRHQYIRRAKYNPTHEEMKPFMSIAAHLAKNTFFVYKNLFLLVGLELEDLINIASVHLVSFLGLFSLEKMPDKYEEFVNIFINAQDKEPEKEDFLDKNKANFTLFLKQRMEDVVRVCRQKAKNIKGLPAEEFFYYVGQSKPPKMLRDLIKNCEKLGFKKLDNAIYKSIRKRSGNANNTVFYFDNNYYAAVPLEKRSLNIDDFDGAGMGPRDNLHNMTPEEAYFSLEDTSLWKRRMEEFDQSDDDSKAKLIYGFIQKNRSDPKFREEIKIAKKFLKELQ